MKKLDLTNIILGLRKLGAVKATFEHIMEAASEPIAELIYGLLGSTNSPTALFGCINAGSGSNYNISAGSIFYNDEVFSIPAFVATAGGGQVPVLGIVTTYRAGDPVKYSDNNNYNTHSIRTLAWTFGASGSGIADFSALLTLKNRININLLDVPGQLAPYAPLNNPAFTGTPNAPTAALETNNTILATTAFVKNAVDALIDTAPGTLDTLNEIAAALGDDPNFATTILAAVAAKVAKAGDTMTGALINTTTIEAQGGIRTENSGPYLLQKVVEIGPWDMTGTQNVDVTHGIADYKKIRHFHAMIRDDADTQYFPLNLVEAGSGLMAGSSGLIQATTVRVTRTGAGAGNFFNSGSFNDITAGYNRGWVVIYYEA